MKKTKKILSLVLAVLICFSCMLIPVEAATFNDINQSGVFVKQQTNYTCTLAAAVMLVRRTAMASGNNNWSSITESSMRGTAWLEGSGLYYNFTYAGVSVGHSSISANRKSTYINLLKTYPQGVVAYNQGNGNQWHAILLTDYDANTDTFYCSDPANGTESGRIPLSSSSIVGSGQDGKINNLNEYWYVKSPAITLTSTDTQKPTISNVKVSDVSSSGYTVTCTVSDNAGVTRVAFPTWTTSNGQDDLMWKDGTTSGNTATFRVNTSDHKNEIGEYVTDIYAYDAAGNHDYAGSFVVVVPEPDTQKPSISNVRVTDINESGFTISCEVYDNVEIKKVLFPVWTPEYLFPSSKLEGQDDIIYHEATLNGNTATCRINVADHYNSYGVYFCDPHVYDTSGNMIISDRVVINVPKFVAHCEGLAPLYTYDVSKNDSIEVSIWAFNLTGDEVDCYYQIDNGQLVYMKRGSRPDVVQVYPECKQVDCGFGLRLDATAFNEGTHNIKILAKSNGAEQYLFENNFVVVKPTYTVSFNANGGSCSTSTKSVKCRNTYGTLPASTRAGYTFDGWYTSATGGTKVTSSTKVTATSNHTLYAHWVCNHSSTEVRNTKTATCTAEGYTGDTYCNNCGEKTKTGTTIAKKVHTDTNDDGICDNCFAEVLEKDCNCNCHAAGFKRLFFKLINFFQKLFGMNKVCACGVKH